MKKLVSVVFVMVFAVSLFGQSLSTLGWFERDPSDSTAVYYDGYSGSRGIAGGVDLDGDGNLEVYAVHYGYGGGIIGLEYTAEGDALEMFWNSDTGLTTYATGTRMVQTGDIDNDGLGEVIFFRGRYTDDENGGLWIYEATGVNNEFSDPVHYSWNAIGEVFNWNGIGTMGDNRIEYFEVNDVDNDDFDEILFPINGPSWIVDRRDTSYTETDTTVTEYGHSGDFFGVLSASGDLQSGFGSLVAEFSFSPRDIDMGSAAPGEAMFGYDVRLGGGSPTTLTVCDTDGDGLKEIYCNSWNGFNNTFVEAVDADTYSFGDTTYVLAGPGDGVNLLAPGVADVNKDGKDEVYATHYSSGWLYKFEDTDGDATNLMAEEVVLVNDTTGTGDGFNSIFGAIGADTDGDGYKEIYVGGSFNTGDLINWNGSEFVYLRADTNYTLPEAFVAKMWAADMDGDGKDEILAGYQGVPDSIEVAVDDSTSETVANPINYFVRILKVTDNATSVSDYRIVTPDAYKLGAAYPNPFNPTTNIEFTLPVNKQISLVIYNELGQEVVKLIDSKTYMQGTHTAVWNGLNSYGQKVSSGVYFYTLKYGNYSKTRKVTFLQ